MRKSLARLLCAGAALMLSGCQAITFNMDELLSAPKVADEQSAIYQALLESAGRGITLEYPRNGDYRSAFVLYDIDGDGEEETLAFYSVSSLTDSNVKISVLDRGEDGSWRAQYELAGAGSSVERVMFSGSDTVVGYSSQDYEENAVRMYRYNNGVLEPIYEETYSVLETADTDGCGQEEIAVVRRSGIGVEVEILKTESDGSYTAYGLQLEESATAIAGSIFGDFGGRQAMYIDISTDGGGLVTEMVYLKDGEIVCPTATGGINTATQRPAGYSCRDYDGDGKVEIPVLTPFTGYESAPWGEGEYFTNWYSISPETGSFDLKSVSYTNLRDGYVLTIPNRWQNMVTVMKNQGTGELTFYSYDPGASVPGEGTISIPIVSFSASDPSAEESFVESGYSVLYSTDSKTYYVKTLADPDMPLILTMDEIRDNFYILQ